MKKGDDFNIHQPHDSLFKKAFKDKDVAKDFLQNRLPPQVLARIDLKTLQVENNSFIDEILSKSRSDLVLSADIDGKKGYIYFLIEFQMEDDKTMTLRLLEYNVRLMREHITKHKNSKLPVIINVVLYAGAEPYKRERRIIDAFENPKLFIDMLHFKFVVDLNDPKTNIAKDGKAALAELVLREGCRRDFYNFLDKNKRELSRLMKHSSYSKYVVLYMIALDKHSPEQIIKKIHNLDPKLEKAVMSGLQRIAQENREEGLLIGQEKGKAEGLCLSKAII